MRAYFRVALAGAATWMAAESIALVQGPLRAQGVAGTDIQTAVIGAPGPNCTIEARPQVRPSVLPQNGILRLSPAERIAKPSNCPEMRIPIVVVFYK